MRCVVLGLLCCGLVLAGCQSDESEHEARVSVTSVDKVLVVVVENTSLDEMRSGAPRLWDLAQRFGYASSFTAVAHPSLPNYLAMAGGSTFGVSDDAEPASHRLSGPSVFGRTIAAGGTARIFAESMGSQTCRLTSGGRYVPRHVPWTYFASERSRCRRFVTDADDFPGRVSAGTLPNVGMLIPDQCHNAHDCPLGQADAWVGDRVEEAMAGPDYRSGQLAIVITGDEDDRTSGNRVLTVVVHPSQDHRVVTRALTTYSLHRLMAQVGQTDPLGEGAGAPDMAAAFGLPIR